jgi:hypothetical protein
MRSRILIRIKFKSWIQIRIKVKSQILIHIKVRSVAKFLVPNWRGCSRPWHRDVVPAASQPYVARRAGTTALCQSQLYPSVGY